MTATTLSHLPLQAASAAATGAGRILLWGISRYARAPLANTSILALTVFTAMAGANALYFQEDRHPSPFFGPAPDYVAGLPEPVTPAVRQKAVTLPPIVVIDETNTVRQAAAPAPAQPVVPASEPIGNADVIALQRKLTQLGFYEGKVDGVFGPKTSGAIRRFEERAGLPAKGELTQDVLDAVASAPIVLPQAEATPPRTLAVIPLQPTQPTTTTSVQQPIAQPAPSALAVVAANEITGSIPPADIGGNPAAPEDSFQPLPNPEPLQLSLQAATAPQPPLAPHRDLPDSPREVISIAVATAKNGFRALASVIENGPQLGPMNQQTAEVAPTPATQSIAPQPTAAVQTAAVQQPMPPIATAAAPAAAPAAVAAAPVTVAPAVTAAPAEPAPTVVAEAAPVESTPQIPAEPMTDRELIAKVQRGLTSLGFLRGEIDGVAGEATAKAIRNFEVYYNYDVTGRVTPGLVDLLVAAGAQI